MRELAGPPGTYSQATLAKQTAALALWMAVLVYSTRFVLRMLAGVAARLPGGQLLVWALVLYVVASLAAAALLPPPPARRNRASPSAAAVPGSSNGSAEARKDS